jgi:hypothetical protein
MRALLLAALLAGCLPPAQGLRPTPPGGGPQVVIDWDARPFAELPFPNDLATIPDPTSPTGLRVNLSEQAATEVERRARRNLNTLSGFGIFTPISVRFSHALDLDAVLANHAWGTRPQDGAVLLIDVDPNSPDFGAFIDLDVGNGRFPIDVVRADRYFPNDPHATAPSLLFEGVDEDTNGDGVFQPEEDTDGDGVFDEPNVWPPGGDPRADLLSWYELETDTLIVRPVVPLRERTRYAVVLTNKLVDQGRQPVRSPWDFVNHLRQTEALAPVVPALEGEGMSVDDVAFAWSFTTGDVTGDLVDLRRGLWGEGPYASLGTDFPARVDRADKMHDRVGVPNPWRLPTNIVIDLFLSLASFPQEALDMLAGGYAHSDVLVGGSFPSPNLLTDRDGDGDTGDEIFELDAAAGEVVASEDRIAFTCFLPKPDAEHQPPFDVSLWGHGYGSNRFDFVLMGWQLNRTGRALCAYDWPMHGMAMSASDAELYLPLAEAAGLGPAITHLLTNRAHDVDNDGLPDSGSDFLVGDPFKTRDHTRQAALDASQLARALRACGTGTMDADIDGDGQDELSCDWDADGVPDIGGPDATFTYAGGSMGGIIGTLIAAVEPEYAAVATHVAGGGLADLAARTDYAGVPEAVLGGLLGPFVMGEPVGDAMRVQLWATAADKAKRVTVFERPLAGPAVSVEVENLHNGEVRSVPIGAAPWRVPFPADALTAAEKRLALGIPASGPAEGTAYVPEDNAALGDRLEVRFLDADGAVVDRFDTFEVEATHLGVTWPAGSPLVALSEGTGRLKGSPDYRRLATIAGMAMEAGDPIAYAPHIWQDPYASLGGQPRPFLHNPTIGDPVVMIGSGIALARALGLVDWRTVDDRYGMSVDQWLVDREVVHGLEEFGPYRDAAGSPILFDPDDLDEGMDPYGAPSDAPLRSTLTHANGTVALRISYIRPTGTHAIEAPNPDLSFDQSLYTLNMLTHFLHVHGATVSDDRCLEDDTCGWVRPLPE